VWVHFYETSLGKPDHGGMARDRYIESGQNVKHAKDVDWIYGGHLVLFILYFILFYMKFVNKVHT